ncbi:MAG: UDP-N-acetylenolpyruvoylglucosamine reductase [Flavobacteriaceae bacterium]|nr:MAG: UDP-N-acetylenolpyruvoylglucosamine reductase [Flavobacteriaceae bacterium]
MGLKGKKIIEQKDDHVLLEVMAGENWHDFVLWTLDNNFYGLENLSLIPGNVGTCPIQNIGAYGVEVKQFVQSVQVLEISTGKQITLHNSELAFGYRDSIFKGSQKGKYIILSVLFKLATKDYKTQISYGAIGDKLLELGLGKSPKEVSQAVMAIRNEKIPDPKVVGNSGSFFKNPQISTQVFEKLKVSFPKMVAYPIDENQVKLAAGWLIDNLSLKGKQIGGAAVHQNQALVLINKENASGDDVLQLSAHIISEVKKAYQIQLEAEVNIY